MRKIIFIVLFFSMILNYSIAGSQVVIDDLAKTMAKNVVKKMKKMPEGSKIAITFFLYEDDFSDTIKTYLSIKLSKSFAQEIRLQVQSSKLTHKILFPNELDNELYESMQSIYTIPDNVDEAEYWKTFLDNQTPDYYLVGKYQIIGDYESVQLKNVQLIPSPYGKYLNEQPLAVTNAIQLIKTDEDKESLKKINQSLSTLSQTYQNLIDFTGSADLFSFKLLDENSKTVSNSKITVNEEYQISVTLKEDAYMYAFFYDPMDKSFQYISMIFPYQNGQDTYFKAGTHSVPPGNYFTADPPAEGQVFIKLIASKSKLALTSIDEVDSEGYIISKLNDKNCTDFITKMNTLGKDKISAQQITLLRTED